ncbi:hypothetical protein BGZ97_000587 [Linnemannia gamsii]|uniref:ubiquitinyl hydrolase 1 n=1 Tax=Linnemannia gamsii TaxID=64522 RepID=A0A9P6QXZ8_9FUNG|nr:hypothetical protein BGZ97_000587 [Linnemannia gamsii]
MIIDIDQPPGPIDLTRQTPEQSQNPPPYQPVDFAADGIPANIVDAGLADDQWGAAKEEGSIEEYYVDDSSSEDAQTKRKPWENSGIISNPVDQSSDEYDDDLDEIADDDEDEPDEEDELEDDLEDEDLDDVAFSDGDPDDMDDPAALVYNQSMLHGPYLQSPRQDVQARKRHARNGDMRKRPQKLKAVGGTGRRFNQGQNSGSGAELDPSTHTGTQSPGQVFMQTCRDVTRFLEHGSVQQALEMAGELLEYAVQSRKSGEVLPEGMCSAEQLVILEKSFFGTWAKLMIDKRPNTHTKTIVRCLEEFVELGCLILEQDKALPELFGEVMSAMFEQGDLEIYRRNPKRPSRIQHGMSRYQEYPSEYTTEDEDVPHLQQQFVGLFSNLGGLEICLCAIEGGIESTEYPDIKLKNLQVLLSLMSRLHVQGESEPHQAIRVAETTKRLTTAVLGYFPDQTDSFKSVSKATVTEIIHDVGYFLLENYRLVSDFIQEPDTVYEEFDIHDSASRSSLGEVKFADFRIEMAVRLMKASRLDLRLAGLVELKEVLVRIQRLQQTRSRMRRRSEADMDLQLDQDRKPIEYLCTKLQGLQIVGYIFGPNIHLEIVQRSTDLLAFLVQAKVLTMDDIDLIWASVGGNQHRSIVYGVYQVLGDLSTKFPQEVLQNLFVKLQAVPLSNWDLQLVDLARSLFQPMVQRSSNSEDGSYSLIPYETLLNVLRDASQSLSLRDDSTYGASTPPVSRDVLSGVAQLLSEGLGIGPPAQDRITLIGYCLRDLKADHPGAIWGLFVVRHILDQYYQSNDQEQAIQYYRKVCGTLSELFILNLKTYAAAVKAQPPTPSPTVSSFATLSTQFQVYEYWRNMQLTVRLDFLKFVTRLYPHYWNSTTLADTLWNSLIVDPIGPQEQDETFSCLESNTDLDFVLHLYDKMLPTLDIASMTPRAWHCIRQYFMVINWHRQNLVASSDPTVDGSQVIIVLAPLYGMDLIWNIALHARLPAVGMHATETLSSLIKIHPGQDENASSAALDAFREGLVESCVGYLVESSEHLNNESEMETPDIPLQFERCIGILKAFLGSCKTRGIGGERQEIHGTLDEEAMLNVKISSTMPMFHLSIHPSSSVGALRKAVAVRFGCKEPEAVRLFLLGKDLPLSSDNKTLEEIPVENEAAFLATKRPQSVVPVRLSNELTKPAPTDLLLKPEFFERIRAIFLLDEKYASQAWEVVTRLPTSPGLLRQLEELEEDVDWINLLDARSPFLLLYSLQIIDSLIKRDQSKQDDLDQNWITRFLELGGQQKITELLVSDSGLGAANSTRTARKALGLMLKILVRLTSSSNIESNLTAESGGLTVPVFLNKLVSEILTSASREGGFSTYDQSIVLNATSLISYLCAGPLGWEYFHKGSDIRSLIFISMVKSESMQIRETVLRMGTKFCEQRPDPQSDVAPARFFLDILQSFLPISKEYTSNCSELLMFFEIVVRESIYYCTPEYYSSLYTRLMETIINHQSSEDPSYQREDTVLVGMLKVASAMIGTDPRLKTLDQGFRIIDYVFDECLFPQPYATDETGASVTPGAAKCQSEASRSAAFGYLEESSRDNPETLRYVITKIHKHFDRDSEIGDQWSYDPQNVKRASCGFVGLQNLGATCYVNSIVQQFYMNKGFRQGILQAPSGAEDSSNHDTLLYQLQVLFSNLQESTKRSYNAQGFCYSYKDWDGNPMNVAVQMDVDEFFSILFDRLENSVKGTPQEELFKEQYGLKLVQQIKSKDCEHISEREDSSFSIQCEVKNKKTLEESLQLYVQGEILDGDNKYKCSTCDNHVDAIKRACIKELPRNLILHLKRFDYDMDTMRRIKINDRFEFPSRLDMEPYTIDYLTRKEQAQDGVASSPTTAQMPEQDKSAAFQYNLVGVLVHTGTADSGHYYSYIKDRSGSTSGSQDDNTHWYHFNDSRVDEFDVSELPSKAFGGTEFVPQDSSPYMKSPPRSMTKPYSAYMLFYERADAAVTDAPAAMVEAPGIIKDVIVKENTSLLKDLALFDRLYYRFVWDLFTMPQSIRHLDEASAVVANQEDSMEYLTMQYGMEFFFSVLIHARDVDQELLQWTRFLSSMFAQYPQGCVELLRNLTLNSAHLTNILLLCPFTQVREAVIELIFEALRNLRQKDRIAYGLVNTARPSVFSSSSDSMIEDDEGEETAIIAQGSVVQGFVHALSRLLPDARTNWRNFDEYFKLMYEITQLGRAEKVLMVRESFVAELTEFYLADERNDFKKKKMGDKFTKPSFRYLLLTLQEVISCCDIVRSYELVQSGNSVRRHSGNNSHRNSVSVSSSASLPSSPTSSTNSDEAAVEQDTHLPSASPELDQTAILSRADFNALFFCQGTAGTASEKSIVLLSKMLMDRIDSHIISAIVMHLSVQPLIGSRLLDSLNSYIEFANDEQFSTILQIYKEFVQLSDEHLESRVEHILRQLTRILDRSPQSNVAYDCLDFFRTISDFGQCGRFAQAWLLRNCKSESDTRMRARQFYMELLSSERAFNGWDDEQAAAASAQHFGRLLELMKVLPDLIAYYPMHSRRDEDDNGWKLVEYFTALTELVKGDTERDMFFHSWSGFLEILTRIDNQQINLDYDKKEMMIFWGRIINEDQERNKLLADFKPVGVLLRKFYVCLQNNPQNIQFHKEVLPIYFGLVLRFSQLSQAFLLEWVHCHNYTWAIGAMKWGAFSIHCPPELDQLLQYTLSKVPLFRQECWRTLPSPDRGLLPFTQLARAMFEPENADAGALFYQNRGLVYLTDAINNASMTGTVTSEPDFFAVDILRLLCNYICQMKVCRNTPAFAEAIDHWSNIDKAISFLTGNLMWAAPAQVYTDSIKILEAIAQEATYTQAAPILAALDRAHCEWRDVVESGAVSENQVKNVFSGANSPFYRLGAIEFQQSSSGVSTPPIRMGPVMFFHPELFERLDRVDAENVMQNWYEPYWSLVRTVCKMDGGEGHKHKPIELAALMALEQIEVGSWIHLDILCDTAEDSLKDDDAALALQNPYVALFVQRFLERNRCIEGLTEGQLNGCATLVQSVAANLEKGLLESAVEHSFTHGEGVIKRRRPAPSTAMDDLQLTDPIEQSPTLEKDAQTLLTALQNLKILGVDKMDSEKAEAIRLKHLQESLVEVQTQFSEHFASVLSKVLPVEANNAEPASHIAAAEPPVGDDSGVVAVTAQEPSSTVETEDGDDVGGGVGSMDEDDGTMMSGVIQHQPKPTEEVVKRGGAVAGKKEGKVSAE